MLFRFHFTKNAQQDKTNEIHALEDIGKMEYLYTSWECKLVQLILHKVHMDIPLKLK